MGGGFATDGWGFLLENNSSLAILPRNLTIGTHFSYQKNRIDTQEMGRKFTDALGYHANVEDAQYEPVTLLIGPHYTLNLSKIMHLDIKTGLGIMFTNVNSFRIDVVDPQGGTSRLMARSRIPGYGATCHLVN